MREEDKKEIKKILVEVLSESGILTLEKRLDDSGILTLEKRLDDSGILTLEKRLDDSGILTLETRIGDMFAENNKMLIESFNDTVDKKIRDAVIPLEVGISDIKGMFKDLLSGQTQTTALTEIVDEHDSTIRSNILPRLKVLETKVS